MVVASEMKHSMQHEYLDLRRGRMSQPPGVLHSNIGCNRDVAGKSIRP